MFNFAKDMKPQKPVITFVLLFAVLLLSACSAPGPAANETPRSLPSPTATRFIPPTFAPTATPMTLQGTISLRHPRDERQIPALVQIIQAFQTANPDVYFDVLYVPSQDLRARYESEALSGKGPNLLLGPAEWGPELFEAGLVKDLTGLLPESRLADLNQPALGAASYQNALIGAPYSIQGVVLYRNKGIVTINPNTLEELVTLAQSSTIGDEIGALLERSFYYSGAHLNGLGGRLMDEQGIPAFNDSFGLSWLELLREFENAGPVNYFTDQDIEFFKNGNIGWMIDGTWNLDELAEAIGPDKLAIDPWPSYLNGKLSGYVRSENIYLNPATDAESLAATIAFIDFFLSPNSQSIIAQAGRIPAASEIPLENTPNSELISQAVSALAEGTTYPTAPEMAIYNIQMDIALRAFFEEGISAEEALQRAEDGILTELAESQITPTPTP